MLTRHLTTMRPDCRARRMPAGLRGLALALLVAATIGIASAGVAAQEHEPAGAAEAPHGQSVLQTVAKLANFAILAGVLVYFLRTPIRTYLVSRATAIRSDLVAASEMRATATAQLAEIERKLQSLPAELAALKAQGAQDVAAEQARIAQAAALERERLIEQTRREIATRLQVARRELTQHAAQLAVQVAEERIRRTITPDDQLRLVQRYTEQLREAR
jgi:F-type H+-transporting ATPase subunit b